jgi:hypothetical protein
MSMRCDVTLRWGATPHELRALGAALWRWCTRAVGGAGIYPYLDSEVLADLMDGKHPAPSQTPQQAESGVRFSIQDESSEDREAVITSLRRWIPAAGVEDIVVGGKSWARAD